MLRKIINQRFHITSVKIMHPMATHFIRLGIISTHILHSSISKYTSMFIQTSVFI